MYTKQTSRNYAKAMHVIKHPTQPSLMSRDSNHKQKKESTVNLLQFNNSPEFLIDSEIKNQRHQAIELLKPTTN